MNVRLMGAWLLAAALLFGACSDDATPAVDTGAADLRTKLDANRTDQKLLDAKIKPDHVADAKAASEQAIADLAPKPDQANPDLAAPDQGAPGKEVVFADGFKLIIGLEHNSKGEIIVADNGADTLYRVDAKGKKSMLASVEKCSGLAIDDKDDVWVVSEKTREVFKVTPQGKATVVASFSSVCSGFNAIRDITYDKANKLFYVICDGTIYKMTPAGKYTKFGTIPYSTGPVVEYDNSRKQLFAAGGYVYSYDSVGKATTFSATNVTRGMTHDGKGTLYGGGGQKVIKMDTSGKPSTAHTCTFVKTGHTYEKALNIVRDISVKGPYLYISYYTRIYRF